MVRDYEQVVRIEFFIFFSFCDFICVLQWLDFGSYSQVEVVLQN